MALRVTTVSQPAGKHRGAKVRQSLFLAGSRMIEPYSLKVRLLPVAMEAFSSRSVTICHVGEPHVAAQ
jgi:hypothetical protein